MSLSGFLLVLLAAFCHATWNLLIKRIEGGPELIWLFSLLAAVVYLPLALWILMVVQPVFTLLSGAAILGSAALHLVYVLLLQSAYRHGDLSLVYPVARATGPVLATGFAVLVLSEVVSGQMALGALIIVASVAMLSGGLRRGAEQVRMSALFGLATGVLIGSYTVWDAYTVSVLLVPPLLLQYASVLGRVVLLAPLAHQRRARLRVLWREHRGSVIAIAVLSPMAYILVLQALTFTPVSYVAPLREVSVLLSVLAGSLLLGEGHLRTRLGWATLILIGMALLATG